MRYFLAFDVGTTAMKCILFDELFNPAAKVSKEYSLIIENEHTELEPDTYYNTFCNCISEILDYGISADDILTVTFTTQGETLVCVSDDGTPLSRAIVWLDARGLREAEYILRNIGAERFYRTTGLWQPDGALPLAKLLHIKKNQPNIYNKTHNFLLLEDYLIYRLTGKFVTEKSLASSTGWYDIINDRYFKEALDLCGIPEDKLPQMLNCGETVGNVTDLNCGLSTKTRVVAGAMDQICSALGAGNMNEGIITETTGTALVIGASVDVPVFDTDTPVTVYRHYNGKYIYMPYCNTAGVVLKWFKDTLGEKICRIAKENQNPVYSEIDKFAEKAKCGSGGVIFLPHFCGSESDPGATGAFLGLTLGTTLNDMARSVLEGIAYMLNDMLYLLRAKGIKISRIQSLGGGSASDIWCSIKASVCGVEINSNTFGETTALGAAILGAVSCGKYEDADEAYKVVKNEIKVFSPNPAESEIYKKCYKKYKELKK